MIPQVTTDRIIETARIEDVVGEFVTLRKAGTSMVGLCPFHNEKSPSFHVSPSRNICKCFSCGEGGNPVSFLMKLESMSFPEALRWLAQKYHIEIEEEEENPEQRQQRDKRESMMLVSAWAQKYFSQELHEGNEGRAVGLSYLRERGIRDEVIKAFDLGYSVDAKDHFTKAAQKQGYRMEYLEATGLTIKRDDWVRDRFGGRVMFPIHGVGGRVIGFGGRTLKADEKAKYLNSPESDIYHKSKILYGIYQAKREMHKRDRCFLVEGYTDVLALHQAGIKNVVASSGTALTEEQIRLIKRFTDNVTVIYDGDAAGIKAALRGIDLILKEGLNVKVLLLPDGEDPDSFSRSISATEFEAYIAENETDFVRFKTQILLKDVDDDPIAKTRLISDIITTISVVPEAITRQFYIQECSRMLKVSEEALYDALRKKLNNQFEDWQKSRQREEDQARRQKSHQQIDAPVKQSTVVDNPCELEEREVLRILLRYFYDGSIAVKDEDGENILDEEGNPIYLMVGEYVIANLENDDLESDCPRINKMFELFKQRLDDEAGYAFDQDMVNIIIRALEESLSLIDKEHGLRNSDILEFLYNYDDERVSRLAGDIFSNDYIVRRKWERNGELVKGENDQLQAVVATVLLGNNMRLSFLNNPDPDVNQLASDLLAEKYFESKRWSKTGAFVEHEYEILYEIVPKVVLEYKLRKIRLLLSTLEQQIGEAAKAEDWQTLMEAQTQYTQLKQVVIGVSKKLGDRTII